MRRTSMFAVPVLALALILSSVSAGFGATPDTPYHDVKVKPLEPQVKGRWGERLALANDLNDDGVNDFFVAAPMQDVGGITDAGRVYAVSGRTRSVMFLLDSPQPQTGAKFGFFISVTGDVDDDGYDDITIGTDAHDVFTGAGTGCDQPEPNGCNEDQGRAWVFSGATGSVIHTLDNPAPQGTTSNRARFGSRIGRAGDVTGDGRPDIIVGASGNDFPTPGCADTEPIPDGCRKDQGQAFIFNGATGVLVRTLDLPVQDHQPAGTCTSSCGTFGLAVQGPGDTNGDGVTDQLVNAGSYSFYTGEGALCGAPEPNGCNEGQGRMYLFSGATGEVLHKIDDPEPEAGATFGFQDAAPLSPGDVNGDGSADLYGNGFGQDGPAGTSEGRAWVFDGRTGDVLYALTDPSPDHGGQFGWSLAKTDYNKDRTDDLYVGSSPHHVSGTIQSGGTYVFDGRDGSLLRALELPDADVQPGVPGNLGPNLGWGLAALTDVNGDAQPDFAGGAPFWDDGSDQDEGRVFVFLSRDEVAPGRPRAKGPRRTRDRTPTYRFRANPGDNRRSEISFLCSFDSKFLHECKRRYTERLKIGRHVLRVRAVDPAGNKSPLEKVKVRIKR